MSNRLYRILDGRSIASCSREAHVSEDTLQDLLNARSDPRLSTLHLVAKARGYRLMLLFEPTGAALPLDRSHSGNPPISAKSLRP